MGPGESLQDTLGGQLSQKQTLQRVPKIASAGKLGWVCVLPMRMSLMAPILETICKILTC